MADTSLSNQIYISRDQLRNQIIEYIKYYLELENVDLTKSSFLTFIIDTISTLTSNLLFYEISTYKEFFLTQAQLPESILNLSSFLGYSSAEASYPVANVLMTIPLGFDDANTKFVIPNGFIFKSGNIQFTTYYTTTINVVNNNSIYISVVDGNQTYSLAVSKDTTNNTFSFVMPVRQYTIVTQEFQIDSDLQTYQFATIDVPIKSQLSSLSVSVSGPGSSASTLYTQFNSLYLMSSTDYGFVAKRTSTGVTLSFGNGLIGIQPLPGSTVTVVSYETQGLDGNVIANTITKGDKLYVTNEAGVTKNVQYSCTNTSPAFGGTDEESIDDTRSNAIKNLVSMSRLVSEIDYQNTDVVIPYSPFNSSPLPVLKRSDIKCNEIQLYSNLAFGTDLVPTRNETLTVPISQTYVPRGTIISSNGEDYVTLFDMNLDLMNGSAYYEYIMYSVNLTPSLQTTYSTNYNSIAIQTVDVFLDSTTGDAVFRLNYTGSDSTAGCNLTILKTDQIFQMINNTSEKYFEYRFSPYTRFPLGDINLIFTVNSDSVSVFSYAVTVTFRKSLDDFMMSNIFSSSNQTIIYDIPVVLNSYYQSLSKKDFELQVIQYMMASLSFSDYRMINDFVNVKFSNTIGSLINMKYNPVNKTSVISRSMTSVPHGILGDRYIVNGNELGVWINQKNKIAECIDSTSQIWYFYSPVMDDFIYVTDEQKKYIFTGTQWFYPEYQIPLEIVVEIFKSSDYFGTNTQLINSIKNTIYNTFSSRFGSNVNIYRSEIIEAVQSVTGVGHCNLVKPESSLFFNFNLSDFIQEDLLEYTPEYIYFTTNNITVNILG